ncbi:MAG: polysaccharide pyruvyl transferase family protein [Acidimicrobiales bacterium]
MRAADRQPVGRTDRSRRLLLIGNYGNGNVGDDAILTQVTPEALRRGKVTVVSRHPDRISALDLGVDSVTMVSTSALRAFFRSDTFVVGGGGMFGRGLPRLVACLPFVLLAASMMGKDVELRSIGAYPDMPAPVAWALRRLVRRAQHVSARDAASVDALGGPDHVTLVRDPAWGLEPAAREVVDAVLSDAGVRPGRPMIAVSLKPGAGARAEQRCLAEVAEALDLWAGAGGGEILFLSFSDIGDYHLGAEFTDHDLGVMLRKKMVHGGQVRFIGPGLHPAVMLGIVQRCSGVVAMRLHAQIFALAVDRPVYGLSFEAKCDELLASVGVPPVRPEEVSADDLAVWLERVAPPQPAC